MMASKDDQFTNQPISESKSVLDYLYEVRILIPRTCEYVRLHNKGK